MSTKCSVKELRMRAKQTQEQIDELARIYNEGYEIHPITGEGILNAIEVARKIKADKLEEARAIQENVHLIGVLNNGVVRGNGKIGKLIRWTTIDGKDKYIMEFDGYKKKVANVTIDDMSIKQYLMKNEIVLASSKEMKAALRNIDKNYKQLERNMWKDQKAMLGLFDRLVEMDGKGKTAHTNKLRKLLAELVDPQNKYLNEFKIYINEEANRNGGIAVAYGQGTDALIALDVMNGSKANPNNKSAAEVYVHEIVHMAIETAKLYKQGPLAGVIAELQALQEEASKQITKEQIGTQMWNYLFAEENSLSEFIAHAMTNEKVMKLLEKLDVPKVKRDKEIHSWLDWIIVKLTEVYDYLSQLWAEKREGKTIDARVLTLATKMMELNNITREQTWFDEKVELMSKGKNWANAKVVDGIAGVGQFVDDAIQSSVNATDKDSMMGKVARVTDVVWTGVNPLPSEKQYARWESYRQEINKALASIGLDHTFAPEGQISKLWNHIRHDDAVKHTVENFILFRQQIDRVREDTIRVIAGKIKSDMNSLGKTELASITRAVLEIDLGALATEYKLEDIQKLMKSDENINKVVKAEYNKLDALVGNEKARNFYKSQTKGLGYYMATGVSGKSVYKNADRIVYAGHEWFNWMDKSDYNNVKEIKGIVDRLATLEGIRYSKVADRNVVANSIEKHPEGITNIMYLHQVTQYQNKAFAAKNKTYVFPDKGEIKEVRPSYITSRINWGDEATEKKMRKLGYKKKGDSAVAGISVYVRMVDDIGAFEKQATAKINLGKKLHAVDNMHLLVGDEIEGEATAEVMADVKKDALEEVRKLAEGVVLPTMDGFNMQIGAGGEITNFTVSIPKSVEESAFKQQKEVTVVLSKMHAEVEEKKVSKELNGKVWDAIIRDQTANYGNRKNVYGKVEYIELGPDAKHESDAAREYAERVWKDMPDDIRKKVLSLRKDNQYIAVRRDLTEMYFGRRAPSLVRWKMPLINASIEDGLDKLGAKFVADYMVLARDMVAEIVVLQKVDIVIKNPMVILNNIYSNLNMAMALGQMPWTALAQTTRMVKATKSYLDNERKKRRLVLDYRLEQNIEKKKEIKEEIRITMNRLKENPVHDLMEAGMFTTIMEDVSDSELTQKTRIEEWASPVTSKVPEQVKNLVGAFWITEDSKLFRMLSMTVQYSDFVARANRYHVLLSNGTPKDKALQMILDEHVNYGLYLGGTISWLDKLGFARFIKYFVGSNKMLLKKVKEDPIAVMSMGFADLVGGQETPIGSLAPFKNWEYTINGPIDTVWDKTWQHIIPPTTLEYVGLIK